MEICDKLCTFILDPKKDDIRDVYSIGLKTLVMDVPESSGQEVAQRLMGRLLTGVSGDSVQIKTESLECLSDLLKRFGSEVASDHQSITIILLDQLLGTCSPSTKTLQKKIITCLGAVAIVLSENLLNILVKKLLESVSEASGEIVRTLVQTIGYVSRCVGFRIGRHLQAIVPLFFKFLGNPDDEELQTDAHSELREICLQGFESFVLRCPQEIAPHLTSLVEVSVLFMKYDPNYCGNEHDEEDVEDEEEEFSDDDYDEDGMDDEDDDTSWKVRRAAVKVLTAVIASRPELLCEIYLRHAEEIIGRFREREENVRLDVIECFTCLVRTTALTLSVKSHSLHQGPMGNIGSSTLFINLGASSPIMKDQSISPEGLLRSKLPLVMTAALKQLDGKNEKSRTAVLLLLKQLCAVLPCGGMVEFMDDIIASIEMCLQDKHHALKLDALIFLRLIVEHNPPAEICLYFPSVLAPVLTLVKDEW